MKKNQEWPLQNTDKEIRMTRRARLGGLLLGSLLLGTAMLWAPICALAQATSAMPVPKGFTTCEGCHSIKPNENFSAPTLAGVFGRHAGSVPGYAYSSAMRHADIVWNATTLDAYLTKPQHIVPGNQMAFPGLSDKRQRAAIIAYLQKLSGR